MEHDGARRVISSFAHAVSISYDPLWEEKCRTYRVWGRDMFSRTIKVFKKYGNSILFDCLRHVQ